MDGLAANGGGQCDNAQGRGDEEVVLGGGNNRNVRAEEADLGQGAGHNVDPDEERMIHLMCALCDKVSIPVFKGDKAEDPMEFKTKALDYMDAQEIPIRECVFEFHHCLEGKARMWYDEIALPCTWNELMTMFCTRFCIYGKSNEDWYRHWASLHFDPVSDTDIDDLINEVRSVTHLLNFPDDVVLATLKNMFPSYHIHFLNVNDLPTMFRMLHAMFPRIRQWPELMVEQPPFQSIKTSLLLCLYRRKQRKGRSLIKQVGRMRTCLMKPLTDSKTLLIT